MIKLKIEIKNDELHYKYNVGSSKETGTMPLDPDKLELFTRMLSACRNAVWNRDKEMIDDITNKIKVSAWIQKHPNEAKRLLAQEGSEDAKIP